MKHAEDQAPCGFDIPGQDTADETIGEVPSAPELPTDLPPPPPPSFQLESIILVPSFASWLKHQLLRGATLFMGATAYMGTAGNVVTLSKAAAATEVAGAMAKAGKYAVVAAGALAAVAWVLAGAEQLTILEPEPQQVLLKPQQVVSEARPASTGLMILSESSSTATQPVIASVVDASTGKAISRARPGTPIILLGSFDVTSPTSNSVSFGDTSSFALTMSQNEIQTFVPLVAGTEIGDDDNIVVSTRLDLNTQSDPFSFDVLPPIFEPVTEVSSDQLGVLQVTADVARKFRDISKMNCEVIAQRVFPAEGFADERDQFLTLCHTLVGEIAPDGLAAFEDLRRALEAPTVLSTEDVVFIEAGTAAASRAVGQISTSLGTAFSDHDQDGIPNFVEAVTVPRTCFKHFATVVGSKRDDVIVGRDSPEVIAGLGGDDVIYALGGNDYVCGGDGRNKMFVGAGNNSVSGGRDSDTYVFDLDTGGNVIWDQGGADDVVELRGGGVIAEIKQLRFTRVGNALLIEMPDRDDGNRRFIKILRMANPAKRVERLALIGADGQTKVDEISLVDLFERGVFVAPSSR